MDDEHLVTCAWNSSHEVKYSRYYAHQIKCPDRPKQVEKCQFNICHEFRTEIEKNEHELHCKDMLRRLRDHKELADRGGKSLAAPVIVEPIAAGESSDPWADEGMDSGVKKFTTPGLGLTSQEMEKFIESYDGNEPVCEYMLVSMSWSQKKRINDKQMNRTLQRSDEAVKRGQ